MCIPPSLEARPHRSSLQPRPYAPRGLHFQPTGFPHVRSRPLIGWVLGLFLLLGVGCTGSAPPDPVAVSSPTPMPTLEGSRAVLSMVLVEDEGLDLDQNGEIDNGLSAGLEGVQQEILAFLELLAAQSCSQQPCGDPSEISFTVLEAFLAQVLSFDSVSAAIEFDDTFVLEVTQDRGNTEDNAVCTWVETSGSPTGGLLRGNLEPSGSGQLGPGQLTFDLILNSVDAADPEVDPDIDTKEGIRITLYQSQIRFEDFWGTTAHRYIMGGALSVDTLTYILTELVMDALSHIMTIVPLEYDRDEIEAEIYQALIQYCDVSWKNPQTDVWECFGYSLGIATEVDTLSE